MVQIFKSLKKDAQKSNETEFLAAIFHKWNLSKNNLTLQIFFL